MCPWFATQCVHFSKDLSAQRIGGIFLDAAPEFKALLKIYCENHPLAVELINRKRCVRFHWHFADRSREFREVLQRSLAARKLDLKELISGLSLVFRHVDKYAISLQEIERNTPVLLDGTRRYVITAI